MKVELSHWSADQVRERKLSESDVGQREQSQIMAILDILDFEDL